jgi:hypothetical protein
MVSDSQVQDALDALQDYGAAKARAAHEFIDDKSKIILARLGHESGASSAAARLECALRNPRYLEHLEAVETVAMADYEHRQRQSAAMAIIDVWRTQQASLRGQGRIG